MPAFVSDSTVEKNLDASIKDGTAYSVMQGLGEVSVPLCAIYLGASDSWVAMLVTLPLFFGSLAQLAAPPLIDRVGRRWGLVLVGATIQALTWIPMIAAVFLPPKAGIAVVTGANILYFAAWHFSIPPWNSTMGDIVPAALRGRYFGIRNSLASLLLLFSGMAGGIGLQVFKDAGHERWGFVVVFAGSLLARFLSIYWLRRTTEPAHESHPDPAPSFLAFLAGVRKNNFARFILFAAALNASAHVAGSVTPLYLKRICGYDYWGYMIAVQVLTLAMIVVLPFWGRLSDRRGNRFVLAVTAAGTAVVPAGWFVSQHLAWSCVVQVCAGIFWCGFNLAAGNFLFDAVPSRERARYTAYFNVLVYTGVLAGGLLGALLAWLTPVDAGPLHFSHWIYTVFAVSVMLRVATLILLLPRFREVRAA